MKRAVSIGILMILAILKTHAQCTPPAPPEGSSPQAFCETDSPTIADIAVTGTDIIWYDAPTGGNVLPEATALTDLTTYYASQTVDGCESDTRLAVTVTVSDPAAPTGDPSQLFCPGDNPTLADIAVTGTDILWYSAPSGGSSLPSSTALVNGNTYYASQTAGGCESSTRLAVYVTVQAPDPPSGTSPQLFCAYNNPVIANLAATGASIQWYAAPSGGSPLSSSAPLVDGTTYYATQTVDGCESDTRLAVLATVTDPPPPTGNTSQSFCAINNPTVASLVVSGTSIRWYASASGGSQLSSSTPLVNGTTYYATQTIDGCESETRLAVLATISDPPPPTGNTSQSFCAIINPTVASLTVSGTSIRWYASASGGSQLSTSTPLVNGTTYYATQTVNGCESDTRLAVMVTVHDPPPPTGSTLQSFCAINNPTIESLSVTGTSIRWYASASGGSQLSSSTPLTNGTTYYSTQTIDGCESDTRLAVTVTVSDPAAPTGVSPQLFCAVNNPTITNLSATGSAIRWYATGSGGSQLPSSTSLVNGITYYASQTVDGCESNLRLAVAVTISDPAAPTGTSPQLFCAINNPIIEDLSATGTSVQWYANASGGSPLPESTALVNGTAYYATQTVGGCESDARLAVMVTVSDPAAPTGNSQQLFCAGNNPVIADLAATGTSIQWYAGASGGSPSSESTALDNGTIYYASQTVEGCESDTRLAVTVTLSDPSPPTITSVTHPDCSVAEGSILMQGLPAAGTWTITRSPGGTTYSGTGIYTTIEGLAPGTYTFTVTNADGCTSISTDEVVINPQPETPSAPIITTIIQPTCTDASGSVVLSGLPASGIWTVTGFPENMTNTGTGSYTTIEGLAPGTYTFTVTNSEGCISPSTENVVINTQPPTPPPPVIETIVQPTCDVATGSIELSNLPSTGNWILTRSPDGTTISGTGPSTTISGLAAGNYTFTVTNTHGCVSESSAEVAINTQPVTPSPPGIGNITQPTPDVFTGSVVLTGLPSPGVWTLVMNPGGVTTTGTGLSTIISGISPGIYTFTVTNPDGCTSRESQAVGLYTLDLTGPGNISIRPQDTIKIAGSNAGSFKIGVSSNTEWSVKDNSLWLKAVKDAESSNIEVGYMENISVLDKIAAINITYTSNPELTIYVSQKGRIPQLAGSKFDDVVMYPNPAGELVFIRLGNEGSEMIKISVANIYGNIVYNREYKNTLPHQELELTISDLPSGLYYITMADNVSFKTFSVIKR